MMGLDPALRNLEERFGAMDELGNDYRQVLVRARTSAEHEPPGVARDLAAIGTEQLAEMAAAHPGRFAGWVAQPALQDGERALEAITDAIDVGALGVQVFPATQGRCPGHPDYEPFFAHTADLERPTWIHPNRTVHWSDIPQTEPESRNGLHSRAGWPTDTTVTMCRLVYAGYPERWSDLKIIVHHSGGTVPMLVGRLKMLQTTPGNEVVAERLRHPPVHYLKRFYSDTANLDDPIALRTALEFFGPDNVLFGNDFGFSRRYAPETIGDIETVISDEATKRAVYELNSRRILRLDEGPLVA